MEGLVRLSVLRHKGTKDAKDTGMTLPDCIENLMTDHVLKYGMQEHTDAHSLALTMTPALTLNPNPKTLTPTLTSTPTPTRSTRPRSRCATCSQRRWCAASA